MYQELILWYAVLISITYSKYQVIPFVDSYLEGQSFIVCYKKNGCYLSGCCQLFYIKIRYISKDCEYITDVTIVQVLILDFHND